MENTYYNEWEKYPAEWLRTLIMMGEISEGLVDETDIRKIQAEDLKKYNRCHFFAGIGGWELALQMAGWPKDREVWTGSCPCQPFSVAGKQKGKDDDRHLWPYWFELIKKRRPRTIFGEQVTGALTHGWWDEVCEGLESEGYQVPKPAIIPACSAGAPHKRDRLWFVAYASSIRCEQTRTRQLIASSKTNSLAHPDNTGSQGWDGSELSKCTSKQLIRQSSSSLADAASERLLSTTQARVHSGEEGARPRHEQSERCSSDVAYSHCEQAQRPPKSWGECDFWEFEPAVGRVANGVPARVGRLRAYGNAIVPQVAAAFIKAFLLAEAEL